MWLILIGILFVVAFMLTRVREGFANLESDPAPLDPQKLMSQLQKLMNKYGSPEVWHHATQVMDKDPGQLARMNLGIVN
jgi:hypothetical protein